MRHIYNVSVIRIKLIWKDCTSLKSNVLAQLYPMTVLDAHEDTMYIDVSLYYRGPFILVPIERLHKPKFCKIILPWSTILETIT